MNLIEIDATILQLLSAGKNRVTLYTGVLYDDGDEMDEINPELSVESKTYHCHSVINQSQGWNQNVWTSMGEVFISKPRFEHLHGDTFDLTFEIWAVDSDGIRAAMKRAWS